MSVLPNSPPAPVQPEAEKPKPHRRMSAGQRILFFVTAWLILLMPFLFWWNTWFGRQLSDQQLTEYLHDEKKPRHIQHALVQIGERMSRHDASVAQWYPDVTRLAAHPVEEVRNTDAWVMGQDPAATAATGFHQALLRLLADSSQTVQGNAALSLVRFGDASGRSQIVALLQPVSISAPQAGKVTDTSAVGTVTHQGGIVAKLESNGQQAEIRSPISGRLKSLFTQTGQNVSAGAQIAIVDPTTEQVWEALRALYLVGQSEDIPAITPYERDLPENPEYIRQQATLAEQAIRQRGK